MQDRSTESDLSRKRKIAKDVMISALRLVCKLKAEIVAQEHLIEAMTRFLVDQSEKSSTIADETADPSELNEEPP